MPFSQQAVHDLMSDDASKDNKVENQSSCYNPWTEHEVSDKSIADCTEAITGAYLLVCGDKAAASFLDWLGIGVFKVSKFRLIRRYGEKFHRYKELRKFLESI